MASIRRLKKAIDFMVSDLVIDCMSYVVLNPQVNEAAVSEIIRSALSLGDSLRDQANHPDGKDNPKLIRAYYNEIGKKLVAGIDDGYDKLIGLMK